MPAVTVNVTCPHCGCTGSYRFLSTIDTQSATCNSCKKTIRVLFRFNTDQIVSVTK
ncbi:MAG: hypothetical protein ACYDHG_04305 [Desulfomonilaceae bacterium]